MSYNPTSDNLIRMMHGYWRAPNYPMIRDCNLRDSMFQDFCLSHGLTNADFVCIMHGLRPIEHTFWCDFVKCKLSVKV